MRNVGVSGYLFTYIIREIRSGNYWGIYAYWLFVFIIEILLIRYKLKLKKLDKEGVLTFGFLWHDVIYVFIVSAFLFFVFFPFMIELTL
jgi:uncharacterized membrane protein